MNKQSRTADLIIEKGEVFVVQNIHPYRGGPYWYFVKLTTNTGVEGWGEMWWNRYKPENFAALALEVIEKFFIGKSPHHVEAVFQKFFKEMLWQHSDLTQMGIFSGVECACWDIQGKVASKPIYELMGGMVNPKLRSYTYIYPKNPFDDHKELWADSKRCAKRALHYVEQGFTALKLDPVDRDQEGCAPPWHVSLPVLDRAERTIGAIRDAVGSRCDIIIGTHGQYTAASAIRFIKRLEKYDPLWFEEPIPPENPDQMAQVNAATSVPVASGERLTTKFELGALMTSQAADIIQIDLGGVGGIWEARKVAAMAEAFHLQVTPHFWAGPLMYAAQSQIAACCPNFIIQEVIERMDGFHRELVRTSFKWSDGFMIPSGEPGLGIEMNLDAVKKYSIYTAQTRFS